MTLNGLREHIYNRILDARRVDHLIRQPTFESAYESSCPKEREEIPGILEGCMNPDSKIREKNFDRLTAWIREKNQIDVSIRDLREKARTANIPRYSRLTKAELLSKLNNGTPHQSDLSPCIRDPDPAVEQRNEPKQHSLQEGQKIGRAHV